MPKTRVYVDTSVFGGVHDEGFAAATERFFRRVQAGEYVVLVSGQVTEELAEAPADVRDVLTSVPIEHIERVAVDDEVRALAVEYQQAGVLGPASEGDAIHVAAATVGRADLLLSWNFRHLVRYDRVRQFNGINALKGYPSIDIRSPLETGDGDED